MSSISASLLAFWQKLGDITYAGNSLQMLAVALALFCFIFIALRFFIRWVSSKLEEFARRTKSRIDDAFISLLLSIHSWVYAVVAFAVASQPLNLPAQIDRFIHGIFIVVIVFQCVLSIERLSLYALQKFWILRYGKDSGSTSSLMVFVLRVVVWSIGALLLLSNVGINVTSLIASLGIGGVAVALAVQNILGDLFSSFSLYFDEPFKPGDFIVVGQHMGTVKKIGLKTTRIQALQGEEIVIPNQELTTTRVQNHKRMETRRIEFSIGVTYDTLPDVLERIPGMIREIMEAQDKIRIDRIHFKGFGEYSLDFVIVYFVLMSDYNVYMDTQQKINLEIMRKFQKEGITLARSVSVLQMQTPKKAEATTVTPARKSV